MSRWREFSFALHQLQHAIQPMPHPYADVMGRWAEIRNLSCRAGTQPLTSILKLALMGRTPRFAHHEEGNKSPPAIWPASKSS